MQKALIVVGLILVAAGLVWPWLVKLPLGRLPGDLIIGRANFRFYFPITTLVVVGGVLSLILWLVVSQIWISGV